MKKLFAVFAKYLLAPAIRKFCIGEVKGQEYIPKKGSFILAPNHQSYFDHFFVPYVVKERLEKTRFIGKMDSKWQAIQWGWFYWLAETIPINRKSVHKRKVLEKALQVLKKGGIIIIYPEGTRNRKGELLRGKTGVAELAIRSGAPVIPIGLIYKDAKPPSLPVVLNIGRPLYFQKNKNYSNLREITDSIMRELARVAGKPYENHEDSHC